VLIWHCLSLQYPKIVEQVAEDVPSTIPSADGGVEEVPVDITRPNPNGTEFDCLYLVSGGHLHRRVAQPSPETDHVSAGHERYRPPLYAPRRKGKRAFSVYASCAIFILRGIQAAPSTEEEMMVEIFKYTNRVVNMIRPRKLLFLAIGELCIAILC
jgi:5'-3' exonuclease